jgi:hypothetical protein
MLNPSCPKQYDVYPKYEGETGENEIPFEVPPYIHKVNTTENKTSHNHKLQDWDIIDEKDLYAIERDQIEHIKSMIMDILYAEFNKNYTGNKTKISDIIDNIDVNIKYKTINITIKKEKKISKYISYCKNAFDMILSHPWSILSIMTYTFLKL